MIFYTYIRTELIRIFIIIFNEFHTVKIPHRFYHPTERFGGYSDEPGICPFVRLPIRMPVRPSVNIIVSAK